MADIREVPTRITRFERIGAHTHIKGLGLDENMKAVKVKDGTVSYTHLTLPTTERV